MNNNNMTLNITQQTIVANNINNNSLLKLLVFEIGKLILALPIQQVQKVVRYNPLYGSGISYVNLTHLGEQEVTIVDLHRKLFKVSQTRKLGTGYFIISKNVIGEPLGIVVAQTPTIIDVPLAQIRILPESYRRADTLEIASHVAVIPQVDETSTSLTIFILDLERLI